MKFQFKPQKVQSGDLRTPVAFFEYQPASGPEPGEIEKITL
ncbi:TPA_asm: phage head-tail adapter protein, partial [Listeria monocytogenes]|nr:phage head-tail adapter protein [Listeria monocytogenes]